MICRPIPPVLTVDELTDKIRGAVCSIPELQDLSVRGELLGFKRHSSGHVYFTVIGKNSRISCVMFRSNAASVLVWPRDGDEVLVRGKIDVYGAYGSYQIYATTLLPIGEGAKARAKEMLAAKLTAEGIFDPRNKRQLPQFPSKVAVITSPTGAALQDVIRISSQRYPAAEIVVIPSLMQGMDAPSDITNAFAVCAAMKDISVTMLVRGGGSRDDLDTFDNENVVRAVRSCPVPVITGLGHQIDNTLADMAADAEAPTPSGAAERLFPDSREILAGLDGCSHTIFYNVCRKIDDIYTSIDDVQRRLSFNIIKSKCEPLLNKLDSNNAALASNIKHRLSDFDAKLSSFAGMLQNVSPLTVLSKGYTICTDKAGSMIRDVSAIKLKDDINIRFRDGRADAVITNISERPQREAERL
jgi:exodeoxyribonuclease VII large subunit